MNYCIMGGQLLIDGEPSVPKFGDDKAIFAMKARKELERGCSLDFSETKEPKSKAWTIHARMKCPYCARSWSGNSTSKFKREAKSEAISKLSLSCDCGAKFKIQASKFYPADNT